MRTCIRCNVDRDESFFYRHAVVCKLCIAKALKVRPKQTRKKNRKAIVGTCSTCGRGPLTLRRGSLECSTCYYHKRKDKMQAVVDVKAAKARARAEKRAAKDAEDKSPPIIAYPDPAEPAIREIPQMSDDDFTPYYGETVSHAQMVIW